MMQYLWVAFPGKPKTGDPLLDALPPDMPQPTEDQIGVDIQVRLILSKLEGPIASQVGTMLDAIAGNAKLSGAIAGQGYGSWSDPADERTTHPNQQTASIQPQKDLP
jgi:hypothetical protein